MHSTITPRNTQPDSSGFAITQNMTRQAMSSREIAELIGKSHDNVLRDARALVKGGVLKTEETPYKHPQNGQFYPEFLLNQRDSLVLASGYNAALRAKIIDRWLELEAQISQPRVPTSFAEALRLAADKAEENERLLGVIRLQVPKVAALNRLANTSGMTCLTDAAKQIGISPLKLIKWMSANRWIYRRTESSSWAAYQPRLSSGLLDHKMVKVPTKDPEDLRIIPQVMVTRRGLVVLAEKIGVAS